MTKLFKRALSLTGRQQQSRGRRGLSMTSEQRTPSPKDAFQFVIQNFGPRLQNEVSAPPRPVHLLQLDESPARQPRAAARNASRACAFAPSLTIGIGAGDAGGGAPRAGGEGCLNCAWNANTGDKLAQSGAGEHQRRKARTILRIAFVPQHAILAREARYAMSP
jgi:hypothetical protein